MQDMERRTFLGAAMAAIPLAMLGQQSSETSTQVRVTEVLAGEDRFGEHHTLGLSAVEAVERKRMHVDPTLQKSRSKFRFATPCYSLKRTSLLSIILGVTFGLPLIGAPRLAAQDNCQPTYDAMSKVMTTPTHIYVTMTAVPNKGDKPIIAETIYAAGSSYVKVSGKWTRSSITPQQVLKREEENRKNSKTTCHHLKDESVNGETAAVYSTHSETDDTKSDGQIWISKSRALPLRQEFDIDSGGPGVSTISPFATNMQTSNLRRLTTDGRGFFCNFPALDCSLRISGLG